MDIHSDPSSKSSWKINVTNYTKPKMYANRFKCIASIDLAQPTSERRVSYRPEAISMAAILFFFSTIFLTFFVSLIHYNFNCFQILNQM